PRQVFVLLWPFPNSSARRGRNTRGPRQPVVRCDRCAAGNRRSRLRPSSRPQRRSPWRRSTRQERIPSRPLRAGHCSLMTPPTFVIALPEAPICPGAGSGWHATNASCRAEFQVAGGFLSVRRHNLVGKDLITWHHLGPFGATWHHLTWHHLGPLGATWHHLAPWPGAPRFGAMIWTGTADYTFLGNGFPHSVHAFDRLCRALAAQARYLQAAPGDGRA